MKKKYVRNSMSVKLDRLAAKIAAGHKDFSKEELQLYVNHSEEIEAKLKARCSRG